MEPAASASALRQFFARRGLDFEVAPLPDMLETVLAFYTTVPAAGLAVERDADMLLFQFGTYNWGAGEFFEFDITRQFIEAEGEGDDAFSQLRCTFLYEPTANLKCLGAANRWCHCREDVPNLRSFVVSTQAYQAALPLIPAKRTIEWFYV